MYVHTHTCTQSCGVMLTTPGGLGGYVLCKELRRKEVGVSHPPFTLRLIAPGPCNELSVTDKKRVCVSVCVWERERRREEEKDRNGEKKWEWEAVRNRIYFAGMEILECMESDQDSWMYRILGHESPSTEKNICWHPQKIFVALCNPHIIWQGSQT